MRDVYDFAKFFVKEGVDSTPNTYDGNMKLQKMLVLANMVHLAQYHKPLFSEDILAFQNGLVIEKVRIKYRNDYFCFKSDSEKFSPDFNKEEYETLNIVIRIYGKLSARELSNLNHEFSSWKSAYQNGICSHGYHDKEKSVVNFDEFPEDIQAVWRSIKASRETEKAPSKMEIINGVSFYYDEISMTENLMSELEKFSQVCDDDAYSVCYDDGRLVIY